MTWDKQPKILTLKYLAKQSGLSYTVFKGRYYRRKKNLKDIQDKTKTGKPMKELNGMTQSEAARFFGVSRQRIHSRVKEGYCLDKENRWKLI